MREISVDELTLGMCLSKDIYNDLGNIILSQGTEISNKHLAYFQKHGIISIYIDERDNSVPAESHKAVKIYKFKDLNNAYAEVLGQFKEVYFNVQNKQHNFDVEILRPALEGLIEIVISDNDVLGSMRIIALNEAYHFTHAVNVSMLSAMICKWTGLENDMIYLAALSGLLHDIGKTKVPQELLYKQGEINEQEYELLKMHAKLGYESLKNNSSLPREVLASMLFHHERSDGTGYPSGLKEEQTPYLARVVAVADVFDAITSDKIYRSRVSSFKAFSIIKDESFRGLDPKISEIFLSNIAVFFINNRVKLSDGRVGEVVYINKYALNRPLIKVSNDFIDLSTDYSIEIDEVIS